MLIMGDVAWCWFRHGRYIGPNLVEVAGMVIIFGSLGLIAGVIFFYACLWRLENKKARMADRKDDASP